MSVDVYCSVVLRFFYWSIQESNLTMLNIEISAVFRLVKSSTHNLTRIYVNLRHARVIQMLMKDFFLQINNSR